MGKSSKQKQTDEARELGEGTQKRRGVVDTTGHVYRERSESFHSGGIVRVHEDDEESDKEQRPVVLPNKDGVHHRQDLVGGKDQRLEISLIKVNARISCVKFNYEHDCKMYCLKNVKFQVDHCHHES